MALFDVVTATGRTVTVDAPEGSPDSVVRRMALEQLRANRPQPAAAEPETSFGGHAWELLKGIPAGAVGAIESGATGISQLLPDEDEAAARQTIAEYGDKFGAPFTPNAGYEDSVSSKLGQGLGSTLPFLAALAAGPVAGPMIAGGMGASMGAGEATQRAAAKGATEAEISDAGGLGIVPGMSDVLPGMAIVKRANVLRKALGPSADAVGAQLKDAAARIAASRTGRVTRAALEEGVQEAAQEVAQNMIAQKVYDPAQGAFQGTGESLGYGAGVGGLIQALVELAIPGRQRAADPAETLPVEEESDELPDAPPAVDPETAEIERMYREEADQQALADAEMEDQLAAAARAEEAKAAQEAVAQQDAEDTAEIDNLYQQDQEREELQRVEQTRQLDTQREQARQQQTATKRQAILQPLIEAENVPDVRQAFLTGLKLNGFGDRQLAITPEEEQLIQRADDVKAAVAAGPAPKEPTPVIQSSPNEMDVEAAIPERKAKAPVQPVLPGVPQPTTPKPTADVVTFTPPEMDALGIPPAAPIRKRIVKKDLSDPAQRDAVATELRNFSAVAQPEVKARIESLLKTPEWMALPPADVEAQGEMFGPRGGVKNKLPPALPKVDATDMQEVIDAEAKTYAPGAPISDVAQTKPKRMEPVPKPAPKPVPFEDQSGDTTSTSEMDTDTKPAPTTAVEPETAPASDVAEGEETLSAEELADIHELAKVEKVASLDVARAVKEKRKQAKQSEAVVADLQKNDAREYDDTQELIDTLENNFNVDMTEAERSTLEKRLRKAKPEQREQVATDYMKAAVQAKERTEPTVTVDDKEAPAEFKKVKAVPKKTQDEADVAVAEADEKRQDKAAKADREKIDALDAKHPVKQYFKPDEALQVSLSNLAVDAVHKKDAKTKEASEWVRKNLSESSRKAYERRLAETAREGRLLYNALGADGYELAAPLPQPVQNLLDNNDEVSAADFLNALIPTLKGEPLRIAKALLKNTPKTKVKLTSGLKDDRTGKQVAGAYASSSNTVYLDSRHGRTVHAAIHELVHAATAHMLRSPSHPAAKQLRKVFEEVKLLLGENVYGGKSLEEFVAEAFSNPDFQAQLASMKPVGVEPNLWQRFVEAIANFIRSMTGRPMLQNSTLKDQVGGLIYTIMSPAPDGLDYGMLYNAAQGNTAAKKDLFDGLYQKLPGERKDDLEVVGDWLSNAGRKMASTALQVLPLNAVADMIKTEIPSAQDLFKLLNEVHGTRANTNRKVRQTGIDLREKLGSDKKVHDLFNDMVAESTLNEVDPSEPRPTSDKDKQDTWDSLQSKYWKPLGALRPQAQQAYKDLRNGYRRAYNEMVASIDERVNQMDMGDGGKASMKKQLRQFIKRNTVEPYFPLYRHGEYWLAFREKSSMEPHIMAFDSIADRTRALQGLRGDSTVTDVQEFANPGEFNNYAQRVPGNFTYKLMQSLADLEKGAIEDLEKSLTASGALPAERVKVLGAARADHADLRERTLKMILDAMPESAFAQQFRKREGTLGFDKDALKVYDRRMPSLMNQVVNMKYASSFARLDERIRAEAKDRGDQPKHADYVKLLRHYMDFARNPTLPTWSRAAKSLTFGMTLGFGIAPVIVNMSNLPVVTLPWLGGKYGMVKTAKAIAEATQLYTNTGFTRAEELLVPTVDAQGKPTTKRTSSFSGWSLDNVDYTNAALPDRTKRLATLVQLMSERGELLKSHAAEMLDMNTPTATVWDKMNATMGALFHHGERLNRQVTAVAAYNLELDAMKAAGKTIDEAAMLDAADKAIDAVEWTNSGADLSTAPKVAQGALGSLLFMYKRFGVSMMYNQFKMARELLNGADPETRRIAKRQIAGLYASTALLAGVSGVPLYGAMAMVWDMLFTDDDDEDFNTLSAKFFGEGMYSGVLNYLTGSDFSSRIGMTNLIMRSQPNVEQESWVLSMMETLGGPVLGQLSRLEDGIALINEGEVWRGLERMTPSVGANLMKGLRYGSEGATTLRGDPITEDVGPGNVLMQALGFAPASYVQQLQKNAVNKRVDRETTARITKLLRLRYMAIRQGDKEELSDVNAEILEMNKKYPGLIPPDTMLRSLKQHMRTSEQMKKYGGVMISQRMQPIIDAMNAEWEE